MTRSLRVALPFLALAAALGPAPAAGQRVDPDRVIDVSMDLGTQTLSAAIREGGTFNLVLHDRDEYEFAPVVLDARGRKVTFAVYKGVKGQPSTRALAERIELAVGTPARLRTNGQISLVVDGIRSVPAQPAAPTRRPVSFRPTDVMRAALQDPDQCCVCCGAACACACGVKMSCGSCCMPGCCDQAPPIAPVTSADATRQYAAFYRHRLRQGLRRPRLRPPDHRQPLTTSPIGPEPRTRPRAPGLRRSCRLPRDRSAIRVCMISHRGHRGHGENPLCPLCPL